MIRTDCAVNRFDLRGCVGLHLLYTLAFHHDRSRFPQSRMVAIFLRERPCLFGVSVKHSLCFHKLYGLRMIRTAPLLCYCIIEINPEGDYMFSLTLDFHVFQIGTI